MCPPGRPPIVDINTDEHREATMSTTPATAAVPHRVGRTAKAALFAVMAALLLVAIFLPLLSDPGADVYPRPVPAPAPGRSP
jgi:hypothetical protein